MCISTGLYFAHGNKTTKFVTPWTVAPRLLCPWNSPGKNTGLGCHSRLQRILPTQGLNPGLLHCRQVRYHLSRREPHTWLLCVFPAVYCSLRSILHVTCYAPYPATRSVLRATHMHTLSRTLCTTYAHTEPHVVHDHSMRCMARVFLAFVGAQLIHNVLLASGYSEVNQLCARICPLSFRPPSQAGHCMTLRRVPCALQWVLISRLFYMQ